MPQNKEVRVLYDPGVVGTSIDTSQIRSRDIAYRTYKQMPPAIEHARRKTDDYEEVVIVKQVEVGGDRFHTMAVLTDEGVVVGKDRLKRNGWI